MYELLWGGGGKYKYTTKEEGEAEKKPLKRIKPERVEEAPQREEDQEDQGCPHHLKQFVRTTHITHCPFQDYQFLPKKILN